MIFINNKYYTVYYNIINVARQREIIPYPSEKHHIIPESFFIKRSRPGSGGWLLGDPEDPSNVVFLTLREHAFCHKLLVKITEGKMKSKMELAIWRMLNGKHKKLFSSRDYEKYRNLFIENIKTNNKGKRRPPISDAHKKCISLALRGVPKSEKTKQNMKLAWQTRDRTVKESTKKLNSLASRKFWSTEEAKSKQSKKRKDYLNKNPSELGVLIDRLNKTMTCEYCGITTNIGNYKRWHGANCRINKENIGV